MFNHIHATALVVYLGEAVFAQMFPAIHFFGRSSSAYPATDQAASTEEDNTVGLWLRLYFVLVLNNGLASMGLYVFVGDVHETSKKCLRKLKQGYFLTKVKKYKRMIRSLPIVKINFGSTNYVEKLTPVVFEHFTLLRIIDTLLVSKIGK